MHSATVFFALAAVATAWAGAIGVVAPVAVANDYYAYPAYSSKYSVSDALTGDHKSASETRDGDVTKGSYSVLQPDGILRTVNYIVTPLGGFQAQVINSGIAAAHPGRVVAAVAPVAVAVPLSHGHHGHHGHGHAKILG